MTDMQIFTDDNSGGVDAGAVPKLHRDCKECGNRYSYVNKASLFCSAKCRTDFTNRRFTRGAILYDLFMGLRFERALAKKLGVWSVICRQVSHWREEDNDRRGGRKSWGNWKEYVLTNLYLSGKTGPNMLYRRKP